jgi:hypothetical protein
MSFIKSIVKELNVAKSMFDIPGLKTERESLQQKIQICNSNIDKYNHELHHETNIMITVESIKKYKYYLQSDMQDKADEVANALSASVKKIGIEIEAETNKLSKLLIELENINDMLKKARANVKGK